MPQSLCKNYLHLVFSTKGREETIKEHLQKELFSYMAGILNELKCIVVVVGGTENHVHILFELHRTKSLSSVINILKSNSSLWMHRRKMVAEFDWQDGYGAFSVGQSNVEKVRHYILNQKEHHKTQTFKEEFLAFLNLYDVKYDEKYIWD